jgi:hypothetical protein
MNDHEVERAIGYTPCVCGVIDGTWHSKCYLGKTKEQLESGQKMAFANARKHLKTQAKIAILRALKGPTP